LANIKSAKKRVVVSAKKAARNKAIRSNVKTVVTNVEKAVASGDKAAAESALKVATVAIPKACSKGILHANNAARKVSRLTKAVNAMD